MRSLPIFVLFSTVIFIASFSFADDQNSANPTSGSKYDEEVVVAGISSPGDNAVGDEGDGSNEDYPKWSDIETFEDIQKDDNLDF